MHSYICWRCVSFHLFVYPPHLLLLVFGTESLQSDLMRIMFLQGLTKFARRSRLCQIIVPVFIIGPKNHMHSVHEATWITCTPKNHMHWVHVAKMITCMRWKNNLYLLLESNCAEANNKLFCLPKISQTIHFVLCIFT